MPMKALKNLLPPATRRQLGLFKKEVQAKVYDFPAIGKQLWKKKIKELEDIPRQINIEVTSICNSKCIMCPRHNMKRKMEAMPWDIYTKTIQDAKELGVKKFALNGYGEIFTLKKDYHKYISYLRQEVPDAYIIINSNGSLLSDEVAKFLVDQQVNVVHTDIDGATKETFEKIRKNLKFAHVVGNIRNLVKVRDEAGSSLPVVRVGMIQQPENKHEVEQFQQMWKGVADHVGVDFLVNRVGSVDMEVEKLVGNPCFLPWFAINIWSNGEAVLCCDDWDGEAVMGNIKDQSITEIWKGSEYKKIRDAHQAGKEGKHPVCGKCSWSRSGPAWFRTHRY